MNTTKRSPVAARPAVSKTAGRFVLPAKAGHRAGTSVRGSAGTKKAAVAGRLIAATGNAGLDIDPFLQAVQRHVTLKPKVVQVLREDLRRTLERAVLQLGRTAGKTRGQGVTDQVLSTQQAADLVGVSRPFLAARIDSGDIALYQRVGNQRRVLKSAVLRWQDQSRQRQELALTALASSIEDEYQDGD